MDWLNGAVAKDVRRLMGDVFEVTRKLLEIYGVRYGQPTFEFADPEIIAARFGCIGCPAIGAESAAPSSVLRRNGAGSPLNELYSVWFDARQPSNRLVGFRKGKAILGPVRMSARQELFDRVTDIQERASVVLITPEDEAFIRRCWADGVYPRGWSGADELTVLPDNAPLFQRLP